ncbi:unnamed protein product, partial [Rangifer tarandus platyrhynchus]
REERTHRCKDECSRLKSPSAGKTTQGRTCVCLRESACPRFHSKAAVAPFDGIRVACTHAFALIVTLPLDLYPQMTVISAVCVERPETPKRERRCSVLDIEARWTVHPAVTANIPK